MHGACIPVETVRRGTPTSWLLVIYMFYDYLNCIFLRAVVINYDGNSAPDDAERTVMNAGTILSRAHCRISIVLLLLLPLLLFAAAVDHDRR